MPKLEYLPEGNRNLVFGVILPPPGYNLATTTQTAERIEGVARPLWEKEETGNPLMSRLRLRTSSSSLHAASPSLADRPKDPNRVADLIPTLSGPIFAEPGTFGFINQRSLFGRGIGGGRVIKLNIAGGDLEEILGVAQRAAGKVGQALPRGEGNQFRPRPGLELGSPELRMQPDRVTPCRRRHRRAHAGPDAGRVQLTASGLTRSR